MFKRISYFLVFLVLVLFGFKDVYAGRYYDVFDEHGTWISNEFVVKEKNGNKKYQQMTMIVRSSDKRFMYCLEPGKSLGDSVGMYGYDYDYTKYGNLTEQQWERIQLLSFYGYGYANHTDIKWYVITQFMIWQTNNLGYDIYFTDTLNGNRIDKYIDEIKELDGLVTSHYTTPSLDSYDLFYDETVTLNDNNNVLNNYMIKSSSNIKLSKYNPNELTIYAKDTGPGYITFEKICRRYGYNFVIYVSSEKQNLLMPGDLGTISSTINYDIKSGKLNVQKLDKETNSNIPRYEESLQNALYGLYTDTGDIIEQNYTNSNGYIEFNSKLSLGNYYVQEISPSDGYQLDETKYHFNVNKNDYLKNITVYEKIIKENFEIIKVLESENTGLLEFEKEIEFGIYDKNDNLIKNYTTDDNGTIKFSLNYGNYVLKQLTSYKNYEKINDFAISVKENNKNNKLVFSNKKLIYRVILNVKSKETLEDIPNIKFELYDKDDNKICFENKCSYTTNEKGEIFFPQIFEMDDYYIKLIVDDKFEYIYENDILDFTIDEDTAYEEIDDYRLVILEYFLTLPIVEEVPQKEDDEEKVEEPIENKIEEEEKLGQIEEIEEIEEVEDIPEDVINEDELLVDLPNTLANVNYYSLIYIFIGIYIIKKLLSK